MIDVRMRRVYNWFIMAEDEKKAKKPFDKASTTKAGRQDKEGKSEETTTVLVSERKKGLRVPWRLILIYLLLVAAGVFIGILFRLVFQ